MKSKYVVLVVMIVSLWFAGGVLEGLAEKYETLLIGILPQPLINLTFVGIGWGLWIFALKRL